MSGALAEEDNATTDYGTTS